MAVMGWAREPSRRRHTIATPGMAMTPSAAPGRGSMNSPRVLRSMVGTSVRPKRARSQAPPLAGFRWLA